MIRAILVNQTQTPTREALVTTERELGERLLGALESPQWAGYIVVEGQHKLAPQWLLTLTPTQADALIALAPNGHIWLLQEEPDDFIQDEIIDEL